MMKIFTAQNVAALSLFVLFVDCCFLAFWCKYKDGFIGHCGLGLTAICSGLMLLALYHGMDISFHPLLAGVLAGVSTFLTRHVWRAVRFEKATKSERRTMNYKE